MHPSSTPLTKLRINTYEDPFLQHQYVCLGHKIAIIRVSLNMSQQELARHIGISRSYLSKLECGTGISGMSLERRTRPFSLAAFWLPQACRSSKETISARIKPFSISE